MSFFAFCLNTITVDNMRGKIPDNDVVTFSVMVNQGDRGHGAALFPDLAAGAVIPARAVAPNNRANISADWVVGPLELAADDLVSIVYTGNNTSDTELGLETQQQDQIEIKILNLIAGAATGAVGGLVGSAVTAALGVVGDPVSKFLGYEVQGPCNGLVFEDTIEFTGHGLASLPFGPLDASHASLPGATEVSFTRTYTDEASHNTSVCGAIAKTEITFSVLQVTTISVRFYAKRLFPSAHLNDGLRHSTGSTASSLRVLLGLRL
jgi:hypothetical protein